jgi:hypothetical protein
MILLSNTFASRCSGACLNEAWARHDPLDTAGAIAVTATTAMARSRHYGGAPPSHTYFYVGSDPDPDIRAALIREFGRRRN